LTGPAPRGTVRCMRKYKSSVVKITLADWVIGLLDEQVAEDAAMWAAMGRPRVVTRTSVARNILRDALRTEADDRDLSRLRKLKKERDKLDVEIRTQRQKIPEWKRAE